MGSRILKYILAILIPAILYAQPQGEIDPRSIWLNGTKTTTASIPFAWGLSSAAPILIIDGNPGTPSIGFSSDSTTGIYGIPGSGLIGFAFGGNGKMFIGSTTIRPITDFGLDIGQSFARWGTVYANIFHADYRSSGSQNPRLELAPSSGNTFSVRKVNAASFEIQNQTASRVGLSITDAGAVTIGTSGLLTSIAGNISVTGTTTLATSLTGLAQLTSGVVSATLTPSVTSILVGDGTAAAPSIAFASDTNTGIYRTGADALGVSAGGVLQTTTSTTGLTIANTLNVNATSDFAQATRVDYNYGYGFSNLSGDRPAGLIGDSSNEIIQLAANTTQAASNFAVFGYSLSTGNQGGALRLDTRSGFPIFSLWFQDNQDNLGGGGGAQYPAIQLSGSQGRLGLGTGHAVDTDTFYGTVDINPKTNETSLYVRQESAAGADITQWVNTSGTVKTYIDKSWNFSTAGNLVAGGSVTATTSVIGAKGYFNGNATNTLLVEQSGVKNNVFVVDTTNAAIGINQAALTTASLAILENTKNRILDLSSTISTRATGQTQVNFAHNLNWTTGQGVSTGYTSLGLTLTDTHITNSTLNDAIRAYNLSLSRTSTYNFPNATASLVGYNVSTFSDTGVYSRAGAQTVNAAVVGGVFTTGFTTATFGPTYTDSGAANTLTYNGSVFQGGASFSPTITNVGSLVIGNIRGLHINSLTGSTATGVTTNLYGVELVSLSTAANAIGFKATAVSASTLAAGVQVASVTKATNSYGVKIDAISGVTNAIGLGITAVPTTATNKYQIALDGTGTGSGIYFNTPTAAGTEYIRVASSGILESSYATTYRIKEPTTSTYPLQINSTGQVAISTNNSPATYYKLYVQDRTTDPASGGKYAFSAIQEVQPTGSWTGGNQGGFTGGVRYLATQDFNNGATLIGLEGSAAVYVGAGKTIQSANAIFANSTAQGNGGTGGTITTFSLFGIYMTVDRATISNLYDYRTYNAPLSNGGTVTNQYGYYAAEMTTATNNYEIFLATGGGAFFREAGNQIYSSAAATLDIDTTTTFNHRIGGTVKLALTSSTLTFSDAVNIAVNTTTGTKIGTATTQKLGFWNATPIVQPSGTGETVGFTAGAGTNVTDASTFTGNVGATAYRISDIVKALKNAGIMAQ